MLILMALRRASHWAIAMHREGAWKDSSTMTQSLLGRRVGLHGFGAISQSLVPMLRPFTDRIQTYSPRIPDCVLSAHGVNRVTSLEELFSGSDIVVELAAATPENYHLVTEAHLRMIPEGGVFVNVGRGCVVDEAALARVAREGKLQIALDVFSRSHCRRILHSAGFLTSRCCRIWADRPATAGGLRRARPEESPRFPAWRAAGSRRDPRGV